MLLRYWILWLEESHVPSNMFHFHCLMFIQELFDPDYLCQLSSYDYSMANLSSGIIIIHCIRCSMFHL
jgi:hypothetical protein